MKVKSKEPVRLRQRAMPSGRVSLYLDIYVRGRRSYEYLGMYLIPERSRGDKETNRNTLRLAEVIRAKRVMELRNQQYGLTNNYQGDVCFWDYYKDLMKKHTPKGVSINKTLWWGTLLHLQQYERRKDLTFRDITSEWVRGFRDYLQRSATSEKNNEPLANNTQAGYFARLKGCLKKAVEDGIIVASPATSVENIRLESNKRMYLTKEEVAILVNTPCKHPIVKRAFLFSCLTGLRVSDVRRLTWGDVHTQNDFTRIIFRQQKTNESEYLDINKDATQLMGERGGDTQKVFDGLYSQKVVNIVVANWVLGAGITKHISFHSARHTFAVMMIDLGVDIYTVSKLLGHRNISTTQIYAKILDKTKQEAIKKIPNFL